LWLRLFYALKSARKALRIRSKVLSLCQIFRSEKIIRQIIAEYADCKASRSKKTTALEKLLAAMLEADMIAIYEYEDFLADVLSEDLFEALFAVIEENQLLSIKVKGESNVAPEDALHFEIPRTFSMF
jgi:hypothetical protein